MNLNPYFQKHGGNEKKEIAPSGVHGLFLSNCRPASEPPLLKYDGRHTWMPGENRQWTLMNHFLDKNGKDRFKGSFGLNGLKQIGIIP